MNKDELSAIRDHTYIDVQPIPDTRTRKILHKQLDFLSAASASDAKANNTERLLKLTQAIIEISRILVGNAYDNSTIPLTVGERILRGDGLAPPRQFPLSFTEGGEQSDKS